MKKIVFHVIAGFALCCLAAGCGGKGDGGKVNGTATHVSVYQPVLDALKLDAAQTKKLRVIVMMPAGALADDEGLRALLEANSKAIGLFRDAAAAPGDGYLFSPRMEKPGLPELSPVYPGSMDTFRLLLIEAKLLHAGGRQEEAERDLRAAAGYLVHLAEQESARTMATLFLVQAMKEAYPVLLASLRGDKASPAYAEAVAADFTRIYSRLDLMRGAMTEDGEALRNDIRETMTPAAIRAAMKGHPFHKRVMASFLQNKEYRETVVEKFSSVMESRVQVCLKALAANDPSVSRDFIETQQAELAAAARSEKEGGALAKLRAAMADEAVAMLSKTPLSNCHDLVDRYHGLYASAGIMRTALAVKAYMRANGGRLPPSTEDLVPGFLDRLPADPFNGFVPFSFAKVGDGFTVYGRGGASAFIGYTEGSVKGSKRSKLKRGVSGNI